MTAYIGRLLHKAWSTVVLSLPLLAIAGCAEFSEWISFESASEKAAKKRADEASLWEMSLMAGRYGVMLGQAREILNLPEPKGGQAFPAGETTEDAQRRALAAYQVSVTHEFFADAARACKRKRMPQSVRKVACGQAKMPDDLAAPAEPELAALSARNDQVGQIITPWWDAVCATAPKPKHGEVPPCAIE